MPKRTKLKVTNINLYSKSTVYLGSCEINGEKYYYKVVEDPILTEVEWTDELPSHISQDQQDAVEDKILDEIQKYDG